MTTRHIFDNLNADGLVLKSLRGAVALNPALRLHAASKSVYTVTRTPQTRVAVISGGGAGHEPAHASYTGSGMLSASVSGDIFASPSASQVLTAIRLGTVHHAYLDGHPFQSHPSERDSDEHPPLDALLVINNYTGDRLNFGLAAERARSAGIRVSTVVVTDDVSLLSRPSLVGPRGLAGNIIVCKILGAAAARGMPLDELKSLGDAVVGSLKSIGASLDHCHVPGRAKTKGIEGEIGESEYELGMGLHNEPGVKRLAMEGGEKMVKQMLDLLLTTTSGAEDRDGSRVQDSEVVNLREDAVVLFVNNLGGISQLEMGAVVDEVVSQLATSDVHPARIYSSSFMTSLNAPGFSVSVLNLSATHRQLTNKRDPSFVGQTVADVLAYLDDPTDATAWSNASPQWPGPGSPRYFRKEGDEADILVRSFLSTTQQQTHINTDDTNDVPYDPIMVEKGIRSACASVLAIASDLTQFDTIVGDGDCGETFASGARALLQALDDAILELDGARSSQLIADVATILEDSMGGTSGALFGLYFTALSNALIGTVSAFEDSASSRTPLSAAKAWKIGVKNALEALASHTPARPGDRTIVDALHPFCHAVAEGASFDEAVAKSRAGASATREMIPRLGRATYVVREDDGGEKGCLPPDPGAWGVAAILEGLVAGLRPTDGQHAEARR